MAIDRNWRFIYLNPVALKVLGRSAKDLLGRVVWDEYPHAVKRFGVHFRRAVEEQVVVEAEEFYAPLDLWVRLRVVPTGEGISVFLSDITTHRRAALFQVRLSTLNALLNASALPDAVAEAVLAFARAESGQYRGLIALARPDGEEFQVAQHTGFEPGDLARWLLWARSPDAPLAQAQRTGEALYLSGAALRERCPCVQRGNGDQSLVCLPLPAGNGQSLGVLAFSYDHPRRFDDLDRGFFTALAGSCGHAFHRAQLYAQAQRNELRYRLLAEATSSLTWTADADLRLTESQPTWRAFTGQSDAEAMGHGWLGAVHPEDRASVLDQVRAGEASGTRFRIEGRVQRADGEYRQVISDVMPVWNARGDRDGLVGVVQDVTDQRLRDHQDAERRRIVDALSQVNRPDLLLQTVVTEAASLTGAAQVRLMVWSAREEAPQVLAKHLTQDVQGRQVTDSPDLISQASRTPEGRLVKAPGNNAGDPEVSWAYFLALPMPDALRVALVMEFTAPTSISSAQAALLELLSGSLAAAVQRAVLLQDLAEREAQSRSIIEALAEGVLLVTEGERPRAANASARRLVGLQARPGGDGWVDSWRPLIRPSGEPLEAEEDPRQRALRGERIHNEVVGHLCADGTPAWWSINAAPLPAARDRTGRQAVLTLHDVTAQVHLRQQLEWQAAHDDLTALPNRRAFTARARMAVNTAQATKSNVALLLVDVDQFKDLNNSLGHPVGDEILVTLARRLQARVAPRALVAHLGGDEFGLLVPVQGAEEARQVAQGIQAHLSGPLTAGGYEVRVTVSVGVTLAPTDGVTEQELLRNAELALSHAKGTGRNTVVVYESGFAQGQTRRRELGFHLRRDLARGALHLVYQPIVDLCTGEIFSAEALARWTSPVLGVVRPDEFIPVAEDTGLIHPLTTWALEEATRQGAHWYRHTGRLLRVSVNVSPLEFLHPELVPLVRRVLAQADLPAACLQLEVTESAVMSDVPRAQRRCEELRDLEVWLALDDFGTGHSSLATLHALPFQVLKLDRAFVWGAEADERRVAMLRSILTLAAALDLQVVAEGIETPAQREMLSGLGCTLGQGYLFARPLNPDDLTAQLLHRRRAD